MIELILGVLLERFRIHNDRQPLFAGVLLVFCYLIVPSVGAMLFADRIGPRLAIGWTMGTLVSALGCYFSVELDTPTGATIVVTFGAALVAMFLFHLLVHRRNGDPLKGTRAVDQEELHEQSLL